MYENVIYACMVFFCSALSSSRLFNYFLFSSLFSLLESTFIVDIDTHLCIHMVISVTQGPCGREFPLKSYERSTFLDLYLGLCFCPPMQGQLCIHTCWQHNHFHANVTSDYNLSA